MVILFSWSGRWNVPFKASPCCIENSIFDLMKIFLPMHSSAVAILRSDLTNATWNFYSGQGLQGHGPCKSLENLRVLKQYFLHS
jgi:hypothetical protein